MAPPSRSARSAALAASVQRSKSSPYPSKARSALVRRSVLAALVLAALALLTISFRSPTAGALHDLQGAGSTVLRPFQIAATRVATPFRDGYDYLSSLSSLRAENRRLKQQYAAVRADAIRNRALAQQAATYKRLLHFEQGPSFPNDYRPINAQVIAFPSGPFVHQIAIAAGSNAGITENSPVVSGNGLVGLVTNVSPDTAVVRLLSDRGSWVAARDLHGSSIVRGMVHTGPGGTLILDYVAKKFVVTRGDVLVTDGTHSARFPDLYPYGIPIGRVSDVHATDTATFLQVQVQPFANLDSLDAVAVLVATKQHR